MAAAASKRGSKGGLIAFLIIIAIAFVAAYKIFGPNTGSFTAGSYLYVHTGDTYDQLKDRLRQGGFVKDMFSFDLLASKAKLPVHVRAGRYKINRMMSNYDMIRMLRNGRQEPVKLIINKLRTKRDFVRLISANLEADSLQLYQRFNDAEYLAGYNLDSNTAMCLIMPDTYEFFWNTTADKALSKIARNFVRFWDDERNAQAKKHGLSPAEAIIIASIVDEETNMRDDKPKIASVYLNRVRIGMRLQADPTVKFGIGDFSIRRITGPMLQNTSPYNTYMYAGIPPGPICTPSVSSIEAVLEAPATTFLYFCAKEDFSGYSNFATTYEEQITNARAYQKALDARGIH